MIIYVLIDPRDNAVRYVGKSYRSAQRRLRRHLTACYLNGDSHKERWLRLLLHLGLEPRIEVLQRCTSASELSDAERFHIARLRESGAKLTNSTPGGDGGGTPHTPESKEKIRRALTGRPKSPEHRRNAALGQIGRKLTASAIAKLRVIRQRPRKPLSVAHRESISRGKGGRPFVDQHGNRYETQNGAARQLALNLGHLHEVLYGKRERVKGYLFRFIEEKEKEFES